ncbi:MAG: helix-turn-helix domain-containing protein [Owenweeksia sp.]|nr:helix-turn-helix domain-containing protein [Owenweeksia sp.]
MTHYREIEKPSKEERRAALESYDALAATLAELKSENPEIEIEETEEKIRVPLKALKLLAEILKATSQGKMISVVPVATEMTTQAAAEMLGCSRPHLVKLLEEGRIPFTKVGKHRRIRYEDVATYKNRMKEKQKELIIEMMKSDEESGTYVFIVSALPAFWIPM